MRLNTSHVRIHQHIRRLRRIIVRHSHLGEDVGNRRLHVVNLNMDGEIGWDVESFKHLLGVPFGR